MPGDDHDRAEPDDPIEIDGADPGAPAREPEPGDPSRVPESAFGGRIERTGIALVHEGEYVVPAPGSGAVLSSPGSRPAGSPVVWTFPVEVEVVGRLSEEHLRAVAQHVFDELDVALRAMGRP